MLHGTWLMVHASWLMVHAFWLLLHACPGQHLAYAARLRDSLAYAAQGRAVQFATPESSYT